MIVIAVIGIMSAIAVTSSLSRRPEAQLKKAARELHANLQKTKMLAAKTNSRHAIFFNTAAGNYQILTDPGLDGIWGTADDTNDHPGPDDTYGTADDIPEPVPIILANYGSGVGYGHGNATTNATIAGGAFPADDVSFDNGTITNTIIFNSRGMLLNAGFTGYIYFSNNNNASYAVGVPVVTGNIQVRKWYPASSSWD